MVCSTFCPRRKFGVITCIFGLPRFISNHFLLSPPSHANPADTTVEWAYAFDVHTNAFFPFYLTLYLAQLFLVPIVLKDNWVCLWVGNTLYLAVYAFFFPFWLLSSKRFWLKCRFAQYMYGVYLGLNGNVFYFVSLIIIIIIIAYLAWLLSTALPFLIRTELLLSPLLPLFASYVVSLLGFNVAKHVLPFYFG